MKTDHSSNLFRMRTLAAAIGLASGAAHAVDPLVTNLNDSGAGSLRQAMLEASDDGGVASIINFSEGLSGTISLQSPLPFMSDTVDIRGSGVTVRGPSVSEGQAVFRFGSGSAQAFTVRGLTVTGSDAGAVYARLYDNGSNVLLQDMVITRNTGAPAVNVRDGNMVILSSVISGNKHQLGPGGSYGSGAGIAFSYGTLTIEESEISDNQAGSYGSGGGINASYADINILRSVISGNSAGQRGGGINISTYEGFALDIRDSTISGNTADRGAGINASAYQSSSLEIRNSSITDNRATGDSAGINFSTGRYSGSNFLLENSVVEGNKSGDDDGGLTLRAETVSISASSISNNSATDSHGAFRIDASTLSIVQSTISGNSAPDKAAGDIDPQNYNGSEFTIDSTTISGHSSNDGPALDIRVGYEGSTLIVNSTISGNTGSDAAVEFKDFSSFGTPNLEFRNSTFSGNRSTRGPSAIQVSNVNLTVNNSTFVNNSASRSEFFEQSAQLGVHSTSESSVSATLNRSILTSGNDVEMLVGGPEFSVYEPSLSSYSVSASINNVIMTSNIAVDEGSSLTGTPRVEDAGLAPLGYRGGFTLVHEPLPGSAAIDTGSEGSRPDNRDQRGLSGNVSYNSDLGAVEVVGNTPPRMVTNLGKQISGKVGTEVPAFTVSDLFVDDEGDNITVLSVVGLPTGLTFNEGVISGTLDVQGSFAVTAVLTDDNARPLQAVEQFVVDVSKSGGSSSSGSIPAGVLALFGFLAMFRRRLS